MSCTVYCLVFRLEQVQPLMERMTDAGVPTEDVTMVFRSGEYWLAREAEDLPDSATTLWDAPFVSLALWWELAAVGLSGGSSRRAPAGGAPRPVELVVVPPRVFTSRLRRKRGG